jgi:hypothetical protein
MGTALAAAGLGLAPGGNAEEVPPAKPPKREGDVEIVNPQNRVPLSFFIDDSTCLVNTAHFFMPQLAEAWPDMYCNGTRRGFEELKKVITALEGRFRDRTLWMRSSELARYWAAKELTRIERKGNKLTLRAPVATPQFTLRVSGVAGAGLKLVHNGAPVPLREVAQERDLAPGTWFQNQGHVLLCFDLPKGQVTACLPVREGGEAAG